MKTILIAIGILAALVFCLALFVVASQAAGGAARQALGAVADSGADTTSQQRSTNVCAGVLVLGSCNTEQSSTTTTTQTKSASDDPWAGLVALACLAPILLAFFVYSFFSEGTGAA